MEELKQALQVIAQVCADFDGKLAQHQQIQAALDIVAKAALSTVEDPDAVSLEGLDADGPVTMMSNGAAKAETTV